MKFCFLFSVLCLLRFYRNCVNLQRLQHGLATRIRLRRKPHHLALSIRLSIPSSQSRTTALFHHRLFPPMIFTWHVSVVRNGVSRSFFWYQFSTIIIGILSRSFLLIPILHYHIIGIHSDTSFLSIPNLHFISFGTFSSRSLFTLSLLRYRKQRPFWRPALPPLVSRSPRIAESDSIQSRIDSD